jgi:hypothetical protein
LFAALALAGSLWLPSGAGAVPSVTLTAALSPERLGHSTTLHFGFQIAAPEGAVPAPLTRLDVRYPPGFGVAASDLGVETCTAAILEAGGPRSCPADSLIGYGSVLAEVPFGAEVVREPAIVTLVRAPAQSGHTRILFYAEGTNPVSAAIVFSAQLWNASRPFGGEIRIAVPLVPSLPEDPDVAVVRVLSTIGPAHLTYYERLHGRRVAYTPRGIVLPRRCPTGGFPFAATFGFLDGSRATAETRVPCPRTRGHSQRRQHPGSPKAASSTSGERVRE